MSVFTEKDYNSSNGMQSSVFGPPLWHTLHIISFNYPVKPTESNKKNYTNFIMSMEFTLPCVYCRTNFKKNITKAKFSPSVMNSRDSFSRFIYRFHNCVNEMLGKKIKISYEEVRDRYEHFRSRCSENEKRSDIIKEQRETKKEKGCNDSLYGRKSKCVIHIVPKNSKTEGFKMNSKCKSQKKPSSKNSKKSSKKKFQINRFNF
jgi:hypothetical protein